MEKSGHYFSVVIPVYNVRPYVERCINSVIQQSYKDIEIILVDDGSTDGSGEICEKYAGCYMNCTVIHQKNKGLSSARNTGFKVSSGEYIYFLDSDDYIDTALLEKIHNTLLSKRADVIGFDAQVIINGKKKEVFSTGKKSDEIQQGVEFSRKHIPKSTVPLYCYRRQFLIDNKLLFCEGIYYEDILFTAQVFLKNPRVFIMGGELYYYCKREGSITTSSVQQKHYEDMIKINRILLQESVHYNLNEKKAFRNIYKTYFMLLEEIYCRMSREDREKERKTRKKFFKDAIDNKGIIGRKNWLMTSSPRLFYCIRQLKHKLKWR